MPKYKNLKAVFDECAEILRPPERLTVSEAARKYRKLNNPGSYVGDWKNGTTPYLTEVMDTLNDPAFNACIFVGPAQTGKTEITLNWVNHTVVCDPADMLLYHPSQSFARDFSKRRIDRLNRHTEEVGTRLISRRDADNTYDKMYRGGILVTLAWPSITELSGRPVGRVTLSDYDRMPANVDGEGAPFDLARKRTTTFGSFAMTLAESSPGYEILDPKWSSSPARPHEAPPAEGIISLYNRGDRRRWHWQCPHCSTWFEPAFELLQWIDSDDLMSCGESAQLMCPSCSALIPPSDKAEINRKGRWVREGQTLSPDGDLVGEGVRSDIASFWLKGAAAAFASWNTLVVNFLKAEEEYERTGSQEALKSTVNTDQGEVFVPRGNESMRLPEELQARAEDWGEAKVPDGVRFLLASVDIQKHRFVCQVTGIGEHMDMWVIDRFDIIKSRREDEDGDTMWVSPGAYLEDWDLLTDRVLLKTYELADGSGRFMQVKAMGYDTGGRAGVTANAYNYYRHLKKQGLGARVFPIKGETRLNAPRVQIRYPDSKRQDRKAEARGEVPVLFINTNLVKDTLNTRLDRAEPGGGYIHFSEYLDDNFFTELTVETRSAKGWENPRRLRNESWDLLVYVIAMCVHLRVERFDWDDPPAWANTWEHNTLLSDTEDGRKFSPQPKRDLKKLAQLLG